MYTHKIMLIIQIHTSGSVDELKLLTNLYIMYTCISIEFTQKSTKRKSPCYLCSVISVYWLNWDIIM